MSAGGGRRKGGGGREGGGREDEQMKYCCDELCCADVCELSRRVFLAAYSPHGYTQPSPTVAGMPWRASFSPPNPVPSPLSYRKCAFRLFLSVTCDMFVLCIQENTCHPKQGSVSALVCVCVFVCVRVYVCKCACYHSNSGLPLLRSWLRTRNPKQRKDSCSCPRCASPFVSRRQHTHIHSTCTVRHCTLSSIPL